MPTEPENTRARVMFSMEYLRLGFFRRRVLVRWHDGSEEWLPVPSTVSFEANVTVDEGANALSPTGARPADEPAYPPPGG